MNVIPDQNRKNEKKGKELKIKTASTNRILTNVTRTRPNPPPPKKIEEREFKFS